MSDDEAPKPDPVALPSAIIHGIVELAFFEGYFEAKDEQTGPDLAHQDLKERCANARARLQAAWIDVMGLEA